MQLLCMGRGNLLLMIATTRNDFYDLDRSLFGMAYGVEYGLLRSEANRKLELLKSSCGGY